MSRIFTLGGVMTIALVLLLVCTFSVTATAANNSEQVVFSGTGGGSFTPAGGKTTASPFGFWIWCEADSTNPYLGQCSGAMYIYALGLTKGVNGTITEVGTGLYMMSVASSDGAISCALHNKNTATKGPNNTVIAVCSAPAGGGTSTNAIVNVTGP